MLAILETFFQQFGYLAVFAVLLACGFGVPIPEDITLVTGGIISGLGYTNVHVMVVVGLAGVLVGDGIIFMLGRIYGKRILRFRFIARLMKPKRYAQMQRIFDKYGNRALFVARFLPGLRTPIFLSAGMSRRVSVWRWLMMDGLAALISVPALIYMGDLGAANRDELMKNVHKFQHILLLLTLILVAWVAWNFWRKRQSLLLRKQELLAQRQARRQARRKQTGQHCPPCRQPETFRLPYPIHSHMTHQLYIGLMSGTSMDGCDAVLIRMNGTQWLGAQAHAFIPYPAELKRALLELQNSGSDELHRSSLLAQQLSRLYADTVARLLTAQNLSSADITAIGCHGQTVRHAPENAYSIQLADLSLLAEQSGIFTIGDFRSRDLAAGGQGAPLVPAFHQALFADAHETRVVLNIGGIANISILIPDTPVRGFDTGPGNILLDAWAEYCWSIPYDAGGGKAAQGRVLPELLDSLMSHDYFRMPAPKSTGRDLFSLSWLHEHLHGSEQPHDVMRTLVQFTADSIAQAVFQAAPDAQAVYICGGGIHNPVLTGCLKQHFEPHITVSSTATLKLDPQWVEAAAFGWLAACWINRIPSNPHHATGAGKPLILGAGYFA